MRGKTKNVSGFGIHLTLDLQGCQAKKLADLDCVAHLLDTLPEVLGMTKVTPPYVFRYSGKVPADKGITGFIVIAESHISIHTFQEKGYAFADVFSCTWFDYLVAEARIKKTLGARSVKRRVVHRGKDFPRGE